MNFTHLDDQTSRAMALKYQWNEWFSHYVQNWKIVIQFQSVRPCNKYREMYLLFKGRQISVGGSGTHIVQKTQVLADIFRSPITEKRIEQALISTVKWSLRGCMLHEFAKSFRRWGIDKYSWIETVRPSSIWSTTQISF